MDFQVTMWDVDFFSASLDWKALRVV